MNSHANWWCFLVFSSSRWLDRFLREDWCTKSYYHLFFLNDIGWCWFSPSLQDVVGLCLPCVRMLQDCWKEQAWNWAASLLVPVLVYTLLFLPWGSQNDFTNFKLTSVTGYWSLAWQSLRELVMPLFHGGLSKHIPLDLDHVFFALSLLILSPFLLSRVPMYSEAKLAFFIYLWYPKTRVCVSFDWSRKNTDVFLYLHESFLSLIVQGTTYVYESFFRPYLSHHERDIDHSLLELRTRAGDMAVIYWQRVASYGQTRIFEILQYVAAQSTPRPQQQPQVRLKQYLIV